MKKKIKMIKVDENTIVEVGKLYMVKHAIMRNDTNHNVFGYVPIIGILHKDAQFSVNYEHVHIDGRFVRSQDYYFVDEMGRTNNVISHGQSNNMSYFMETVYLKRKCRRLTTGIKPPPQAKQYQAWVESMIGKSCAGKRCPHLGTTMHEHDGVLVCPLHNLHGDMKTEKIIHQCQSGE